MAENFTNVYDLLHPNPPPLKQLASISVALELWRREINEHRATDTLNELDLEKKISLDGLKSLLPSTVISDIEKYTEKVGNSIYSWLYYRCKYHCDKPNEILRDFDDFVFGFNGYIHLSRTAKRMMLYDQFSIDEKFEVACTHCLEDDVVRIWPSVSTRFNLDDIDFVNHPMLYYWICRLTNQLQKITEPYLEYGENAEEIMLSYLPGSTWFTTHVDYLWNRLVPGNRWRCAINLKDHYSMMVYRYVLAKLNEQELDKFVAKEGDILLRDLINYKNCWPYVSPVWSMIKDKLHESQFLFVARFIFEEETNYRRGLWKPAGREIWKSAPNNLKQAVIRKLLPKSSLFVKEKETYLINEFRSVSFLLAVLSDVSFEERSDFWQKNWRNLLVGCRTEDFSKLIHLCFNNETEIAQFKESALSKYENIRSHCSALLYDGYFKELEKFMNFCCSSEQASRDITLNIPVNWMHF